MKSELQVKLVKAQIFNIIKKQHKYCLFHDDRTFKNLKS